MHYCICLILGCREDILGGEHAVVADTWKTISAVYRCSGLLIVIVFPAVVLTMMKLTVLLLLLLLLLPI